MYINMYEIPIFPLHTVLFPGMPLQLQIFEERYKVMLQRVLQSNHTFGVTLIHEGQEAMGPLPDPVMVGCTARIISVEPQENGHILVTAVGDERFKIVHLAEVEPYYTGFVESLPLDAPLSIEVTRRSQRLRADLARYLALLAAFAGNAEEDIDINLDLTQMQLPEDPLMLVYLACALLQIPAHEKQPLLEAPSARDLLTGVQRLYRRELAVLPPILHTDNETAEILARLN